MRTPTWVITGLLDSGKTTLINKLIEEVFVEVLHPVPFYQH